MAFRVTTEQRAGRTVHHLHDDASGARASVLPSYGFNLFDLRLPTADGVRPIVYAAEGWADAPSQPGRNGIPILFPFPNRIRDGQFTFDGQSYQLRRNKPPHAIHGFAIDVPWSVVEHVADQKSAHITGRFRTSEHAPDRLGEWPADAELLVRYSLAGCRCSLEIKVMNPSDADLPFGFGIHSYFRLPIDPATDPSRTRLVLPAAEAWALEAGLPTGDRVPVDARIDFRAGRPVGNDPLDDVLTGLEHDGPLGVARFVDEGLGTEFRLGFDRSFRELVVFTPPGVPGVIAVEPYTQTTDAINLETRGVDAGLRRLGPGKSTTIVIIMETQALARASSGDRA